MRTFATVRIASFASRTMKKLSLIFPAYNEASRLPSTLAEVIAFCREELDEYEIIVVDDGSSDDTEAAVRFHPEVRYLPNGRNLGKGESVKKGMLAATLDVVLFSDVDLSTPIAEARPLFDAIERGADIAIANRVAKADKLVRRTPLRRFIAWCFRFFVRVVALRGIEDTQCGFKMFRRDVVHDIFPLQKLSGWAFDVELLYLAQKRGYRIDQVPVEWRESDDSRLSIWSPLQMARDILRIRWLHRGLSRSAVKPAA